MLSKLKSGAEGKSQLRRRFKIFRMTRCGTASPYKRMEEDGKMKMEDAGDKENRDGEAKEKKPKKRSWKRFRQVALTTCRYIGMGVAHMSPATVYSVPNYYIDPKGWDKSFSPSYRAQPHPSSQHWTSNMMFSAGW